MTLKAREQAMAGESTLTTKGQATIPKSIRDGLHMKAGDRMTFTLMDDGTVLLRVKSKRMAELAGMLRKSGRKVRRVDALSR